MKPIITLLTLFLAINTGCKSQDTLSYTKTELIYGRKDGLGITMFKMTPKGRSNGKAIMSVVSGNWISSFVFETYLEKRATIYTNKGYTVFMTMHGSQPRYSIPDEIADLKRAVRFIRYNAKEFKINPDHIGITGSSSGGHLALMVALSDYAADASATDPIDKVSSRVQAAAVFYPPTNFIHWGKSNTNLAARKPQLMQARVASAFEFKTLNDTTNMYEVITDPDKVLTILKETSPFYAVSSDDPPVMIIHGDADPVVPLEQSETLIQKLKDAKVTNQFILKKGGSHGWKNIETDEQNFVDWFDKYLK